MDRNTRCRVYSARKGHARGEPWCPCQWPPILSHEDGPRQGISGLVMMSMDTENRLRACQETYFRVLRNLNNVTKLHSPYTKRENRIKTVKTKTGTNAQISDTSPYICEPSAVRAPIYFLFRHIIVIEDLVWLLLAECYADRSPVSIFPRPV